jgi:Ca2+/Na+ antiporter
MICTVFLLVVMFVAVALGIFFRRLAVACSMLVLYIAIASVIICFVTHWESENKSMAIPSGIYSPARERG